MASKSFIQLVSSRAKQIRKARPGMKWTNAIKQASRELKRGVSGVGAVKKKRKAPAKKRATVKVVKVRISGTKTNHKSKKTTMAKTKRRRRYSRMSGTRGRGYMDILMLAGGAVAGGVAAEMLAGSIGKNMNPKMVQLGQIAAGGIVVKSFSGQPFLMGMGVGVMAKGAGDLLKSTGFLKGVGADDDFYMSGDDDYMNGDEDYMSGDEDAGGLNGEDDASLNGDEDMY